MEVTREPIQGVNLIAIIAAMLGIGLIINSAPALLVIIVGIFVAYYNIKLFVVTPQKNRPSGVETALIAVIWVLCAALIYFFPSVISALVGMAGPYFITKFMMLGDTDVEVTFE